MAGVKRGRGNLGAQGAREGKERNPSLLLPRALISFPFERPATQARKTLQFDVKNGVQSDILSRENLHFFRQKLFQNCLD